MVAGGGNIVTGGVHQLNDGSALVHGAVSGALHMVTGVHQQDLFACVLIALLQGGNGRIGQLRGLLVDVSVHVVGVQDGDLGFFTGPAGRRSRGPDGHGGGSGGDTGGLQEIAAGDHVHGFHSGCSFPGAGGSKKDPLHLRNGPFYGNKRSRPCVFIHKDRIGKIRFCGATLLALLSKRRASHGEPTLPCPVTEASVPSYCGISAFLPGPRRPTNLCPALARLHCPGSLQMRCAGSLPPHRFDCIIHFIRVKSRGNFSSLQWFR